MNGWVKLHRSIHDWEWYNDPNMCHLFLHLITIATIKDGSWHGVEIKRGDAIFGLRSLSEKLGISIRTLRTCLNRLKSTREVTLKTTHQFTIVTICNYEHYQGDRNETDTLNDTQTDKQLTHDRHTTDTILRIKKVRNKKSKKETGQTSLPDTKKDYLDSLLIEFQEAYKITGIEYEILNPGKEKEAMGKLATLYKKKYPDAKTEEALFGMRAFFDRCMQINDPWLKDNMSPSIIISKFNEINKILRNGNQRTNSKGGATDAELEQLYINKYTYKG